MTLIEVSITLWAVFQISKGVTFHQLNLLHLKYNYEFSELVMDTQQGKPVNANALIEAIQRIRQQPIDCLAEVNFVDKFMMRHIGTAFALDICERDLDTANSAITTVHNYMEGIYTQAQLAERLSMFSEAFVDNSSQFEVPITNTVDFIVRTMIPLVIIISFFNILFIVYLARSIIGSINDTIGLLLGKSDAHKNIVDKSLSKELYDLVTAATQRVQEDEIKSKVNEQLEELVEKRTNSLVRANEELAQFAYRASHDLKAPLTSTKGLSRFIVQDIDGGYLKEAKVNASLIATQMEKLEELVISILSLTKADESEENQQEIDFNTIIEDIKQRVNGLIASNKCELICDLDVNQSFVSQKARITQILENLISNAIKYSDEQKDNSFAKVKISEHSQTNTIRITVEDNGLGIPKDRQKEVFQMFRRFHPKVSFGSGLGMAIVKKHIDMLGGKIRFDSSPEGTSFNVDLPR
jgi:signal transduction histidine kinase